MKKLAGLLTGLFIVIYLSACVKSEQDNEVSIQFEFTKDHVMEQALEDVRLADGAPLSIHFSYRWSIRDIDSFQLGFEHPYDFDSLILQPRAREITNIQAVKFKSIDSVFTTDRERFVNELRQELLFGLGGNEAIVKEVIITALDFPLQYTKALEEISLKKKEIERIQQQSLVELAQSEASKKQAESDAKVRIAQAEANSRLEKIKAATEENVRASQLAKAETEKQVSRLKAESESEKQRISALAKLDNERAMLELKRQNVQANQILELEHDQKKNDLALANQRAIELQKMELSKQQRTDDFNFEVDFAQLCSNNPSYANYLVTKELASQVEIAILPTGSEMGVFEDMIKTSMNKRVQ